MSQALIHGFKELDCRPSPETGSMAHYFVHEKSGAKLLFLENDQREMLFTIGFRTIPEDSTGVAHIIEHCVLSGSQKFRVKEPFMSLVANSLQTFINAFTGFEMTMFPLASKNKKDFLNLIYVYLDAVFFPLLHENPMIFRQEGWHYEMEDMDSPITVNGVVYNEMRGGYGDPASEMSYNVLKTCYPGSTYANESGGFPWEIPNLSYETFCEFHKRLYHPSNALIVLMGDVDFDEVAGFIDKEYLANFTAIDPHSAIIEGTPLQEHKIAEFSYNGDPEDSPEGDAMLTWNVNCGKRQNLTDRLIYKLLVEILLTGEASPVREALLEANIGTEIEDFGNDSYFLDFGVRASGAKASDRDRFMAIIQKVLREQLEKGFDRDLIEASLNSLELDLRLEGGERQRIFVLVNLVETFCFGHEPLSALEYNQAFQEIREGLDDGILERFLKERILDAPGSLLAVHVPDAKLYKRRDQKLKEDLAALKASMSEAERQDLIDQTNALRAYQQTEDTPEAIASIPNVTLADVDTDLEELPETTVEIAGVPVDLHPTAAAGLNYQDLYFPLHHLTLEEMQDLAIITALLGLVDLHDMDYKTLDTELRKYSSGLDFDLVALDKDGTLKRYLAVGFTSIGARYQKLLPLVLKVLLESDFKDLKRVHMLLEQEKLALEKDFDYEVQKIAMTHTVGRMNPAYMLDDLFNGFAYYDLIAGLIKDETALEATLERLPALIGKVFNRSGLRLAITADEAELEAIAKAWAPVFEALPEALYDSVDIHLPAAVQREAFTTSDNVNYVVMGADYKQLGFSYEPGMTAVANFLSNGYLHNIIRAQNGAYGGGDVIKESGGLAFYSYRDPQLKKTYDTFKSVPEYLRNLDLNRAAVERALIGTVNAFDPVILPMQINDVMFSRRLAGKTHAMLVAQLEGLLQTTADDFRSYADLYRAVLDTDQLCVVGNRKAVAENAALFDSIRPLKA